MVIDRRRFMGVMGAWGASAALPPALGAQSDQPSPISYEEVRAKLAGTKLFLVPYSHNDHSWICTNLWDRERGPLVHKEALDIMFGRKSSSGSGT